MRTTMAWTLVALAGALAAAAVAIAVTPGQARACGGCFAPTDSVTVVTAHRMAVAIGSTETTLWDQIQYAGDPEDFVWVLPIQGETLVELADNAFFEALGAATQIQLQGFFAPLGGFCPDPCGGSAGAADAGAASGPDERPVEVFGEAVVGPYETATIGSEDPTALVTWLRDHGYNVPDSILPIVQHYVAQGMNFAVLRLGPDAGVSQMQPVRITTPGMMPVFPLRMVAAGVEGKVGLELYVLGEGRWGAQNFAVGEIATGELAYDWSTGRFNYDEVFDATLAGLGGRAWIAEYAQPADRFEGFVSDYRSLDPDTGEYTGSAAEDWAVVTRSLPSPYLTKLRTDLLASFLDQDLILEADTGGTIESFIQVYAERNRPPTPSCPTTCTDPAGPTGGGPIGLPGSGMTLSGGGSRGDGLCSVQPGGAGSLWLLGTVAAVAGLLLASRRRRSARH